MPQYLYENPKTGEIIEVIQTMKEPHVYFKDGIEYKRVFTNPQASIDTRFDPLDSKDFARKTGQRKGTMSDLWEKSQELSEKREKIMGRDEVKEKWKAKEKKKRGGKLLPSELAANQNKVFEI